MTTEITDSYLQRNNIKLRRLKEELEEGLKGCMKELVSTWAHCNG